jgi:hypothetical protein
VLSYFAIFFLGLSEVSSIFLIFCELGQKFPPTLEHAAFDTLVNLVCVPGFVLTFLYYRVFLWWWPVSYRLLTDVLTVTNNGQAEKLRPGKSGVLYLLLCLDFPMGCLQLYWSAAIVTKLQAMLAGE